MMNLYEFANWIGLPREGAEYMEAAAPKPERTRELLNLLAEDEKGFFDTLRTFPHPEAAALYLFVRYAMEQQRRWQDQKISMEIYRHTMSDIAIWYRECMRRTGKPGVVEWDWIARSVKGEVYRLGRLQYQPRKLKAALCFGGKEYPENTPVLEIHIPADGPLLPGEVNASLQMAESFFPQKKRVLRHCHSWLLSPQLKEMLPPDSNILYFQKLYSVYQEDFSYRQAEERVFGEVKKDISSYPENTSLQRGLKRFLLSGRQVSMGAGVIKADLE